DDDRLAVDIAKLAQGLEERIETWRPRLQCPWFEGQKAKPWDWARLLRLARRRPRQEGKHGEKAAHANFASCCIVAVRRASIHRAAGGDWPDLLDSVAAHTDIPVVEVDRRVAMAGDQPDLVAEPEPVGGGRDGEPAVLVRRTLISRGRLVANQRRAR